MKPSEVEARRWVPAPGPDEPRLEARRHRFEQVLREGCGGGNGGDGQRGGRDRNADAAGSTLAAAHLRRGARGAVGAVGEGLRAAERSLAAERDLDRSGRMLAELLAEIAHAVRLRPRLPGVKWRLVVRLREDLLPATELDVACLEGVLQVVLRTASPDACQALHAALPELKQALLAHGLAGTAARVCLVDALDLPGGPA